MGGQAATSDHIVRRLEEGTIGERPDHATLDGVAHRSRPRIVHDDLRDPGGGSIRDLSPVGDLLHGGIVGFFVETLPGRQEGDVGGAEDRGAGQEATRRDAHRESYRCVGRAFDAARVRPDSV